MILAFFNAAGIIYTNMILKGTTVLEVSIVKVLCIIMQKLGKKRFLNVEQGWIFHSNKVPVCKSAVVCVFLAANGVEGLDHPPYSPDLVPEDLFFFPNMKQQLARHTLTSDSLSSAWIGVVQTAPKMAFLAAFQRWFEHCEKYVVLDGDYIKKSIK